MEHRNQTNQTTQISAEHTNYDSPSNPNKPNQKSSHKSDRNSKSLIFGMAICSILALCGIGFGVYGMMESTHKSSEIDQLKVEINDKDQKIADFEATNLTFTDGDTTTEITDSAVAAANPVLSANSPEFYQISYTSPLYFAGNDTRYKVNLSVRDGDISSCEIIRNDQHVSSDCGVSGLSGKIYKIVSAGEGQNVEDGEVAFILTDGSVQYTNVSDILNNSTASIKGTYNIDGPVVDAVEAGVYQEGQPTGGYVTTLFVRADGSYIPYGSIAK